MTRLGDWNYALKRWVLARFGRTPRPRYVIRNNTVLIKECVFVDNTWDLQP